MHTKTRHEKLLTLPPTSRIPYMHPPFYLPIARLIHHCSPSPSRAATFHLVLCSALCSLFLLLPSILSAHCIAPRNSGANVKLDGGIDQAIIPLAYQLFEARCGVGDSFPTLRPGPGSAPVSLTILLDRSSHWVFRAGFVSNIQTLLSIYLFTFVHWPEGFVWFVYHLKFPILPFPLAYCIPTSFLFKKEAYQFMCTT